MNIEEYSKQLDNDGIVIIPNVFTPTQLKNFDAAATEQFNEVKKIVSKYSNQETEYITAFDKIYYNKKVIYDANDGTKIIELAKGRYDFTLNTTSGIFSSDEFLNPQPVEKLIKLKLKSQYSQHAGAVPAVPCSDNGPWHRDTYPLFDEGDGLNENYDDTIEVKMMPPFYFTMLIPLKTISPLNGSTEFILASHKKSYAEAKDFPRLHSEVEAGSVILFDGRIFHRGRENQTAEPRMVLYKVYHKNWYNDY